MPTLLLIAQMENVTAARRHESLAVDGRLPRYQISRRRRSPPFSCSEGADAGNVGVQAPFFARALPRVAPQLSLGCPRAATLPPRGPTLGVRTRRLCRASQPLRHHHHHRCATTTTAAVPPPPPRPVRSTPSPPSRAVLSYPAAPHTTTPPLPTTPLPTAPPCPSPAPSRCSLAPPFFRLIPRCPDTPPAVDLLS